METSREFSAQRIKIGEGNINSLRYADDTTLTAEELKSLLMRVKEDSERAGLRLILKTLRSWHLPPLLLLLLLLSCFSLVQLCVTT